MIYALLGAVAIGLVLGLLGSGGSILTVPVLVYLAGQTEKVAIAESLAIVGAIAFVGAASYARRGLVDWRSVVGFGVPGIAGTFGGAVLAAHVPGSVQLVLFGGVMLAAAGAMLRGRSGLAEGGRARRPAGVVAALGASVGAMTGLVGVGGGFLIVPALVLLLGLDMRLAVGTSLSIIVLNCATGFLKYLDVIAEAGEIDFRLVATFSVIGVAGSLVGTRLSPHVPQAQLRRGFAVFLVAMGVFILYKEAPGVLAPAVLVSFPLDTPPLMSFLSRLTGGGGDSLAPADFVAQRDPSAPVLDVRTPAEFAGGHLAGAVNVDVMAPDFTQQVEAMDLPNDGPVYLYCRSGNRSGQATGILRSLGHSGAVNVGGFDALARAGAETA